MIIIKPNDVMIYITEISSGLFLILIPTPSKAIREREREREREENGSDGNCFTAFSGNGDCGVHSSYQHDSEQNGYVQWPELIRPCSLL